MGGSGDYFEVADTVVMMDNYKPENATKDAMKIKDELPINRKREVNSKFKFKKRYPKAESIKPYKGRKLKLDVRGRHTILLGVESIDLSQVEQLMDTSQTRAIAYAINHAQKYMDGKHSIKDLIGIIEQEIIDENGLDILAPNGRRYPHNLARPRIFEFIAALNRLRTFKTRNKRKNEN